MQTGIKHDRFLYTRYSFVSQSFFKPFTQSLTHTPHERMVGLFNQLQWRATSRACDETICLANIMGLDPQPILNISEEEPEKRMVQFLQMIKIFPRLLLVQPPPRLREDGFRWAPRSLLNCFRVEATQPFEAIGGTAEMGHGGTGARMISPGILLTSEDSTPLSIGVEFNFLVTVNGRRLRCTSHFFSKPDTLAANADGSNLLSQPAITCITSGGTRGMRALLVDMHNYEQHHAGTGELFNATYIAPIGINVAAGEVGLPIESTIWLEGVWTSDRQDWVLF